jgi:hypothetical protein
MPELRAALAGALDALVDSGDLTLSSPYVLSSPTVPCAMVAIGPPEYDHAMGGGLDDLTFTVSIVVGMASELDAQEALDEFLSRGSDKFVKALLEADPTLGGRVDDLQVTAATGQRVYALDSASGAQSPPVLGCEWTVKVMA